MTGVEFPKVDDALLAEAVRRIRAVGDPLKIVLFGSWARGTPHEHSDLDLLIVESTDDRHARVGRYYEALCDLHPSKDIVVYTPHDVEEWSQVPMAFITTILREGQVLYEDPI